METTCVCDKGFCCRCFVAGVILVEYEIVNYSKLCQNFVHLFNDLKHTQCQEKYNAKEYLNVCYHNAFCSLKGCGSVVNNTLKSPGYPNVYPEKMTCVYKVAIPQRSVMNISFNDFNLEFHSSCR